MATDRDALKNWATLSFGLAALGAVGTYAYFLGAEYEYWKSFVQESFWEKAAKGLDKTIQEGGEWVQKNTGIEVVEKKTPLNVFQDHAGDAWKAGSPYVVKAGITGGVAGTLISIWPRRPKSEAEPSTATPQVA